MTQKITVSLPDTLVDDARAAVGEGRAASVSALVAAALREKLERRSLDDILDEWDEELGPPGPEAEAWAKEQIDRIEAKRR